MQLDVHDWESVDRRYYLAALNHCFPGWGDERRFDWCFARALAGRKPDLLVLRDGGDPIAGSAITYRMLELTDGTRVRAGIMSGSWTLPAARGRGAFTRILHASREIALTRDAPLLLGFVTATNFSRQGLISAGALEIPSYYCRLSPGQRAVLPAPRVGAARFVYSEEEWRSQFLERPNEVERVGGAGWNAILERSGATDRILHIEGDHQAAFDQLGARGRELFAYSMVRPEGFDITEGYFSILTELDVGNFWDVRNGDRM